MKVVIMDLSSLEATRTFSFGNSKAVCFSQPIRELLSLRTRVFGEHELLENLVNTNYPTPQGIMIHFCQLSEPERLVDPKQRTYY